MRIGILADIHEDIERLTAALARLSAEKVDAIVTLGDILESGDRIDMAVNRLTAARTIGVWGNHEFGLCLDVDEWIRERFAPAVLEYMATLKPHLVLDQCHFSHMDPCENATDPSAFYFHAKSPTTSLERISACLNSAPHRRFFLGHYHRWEAADESGPIAWDGKEPLRFLPNKRYLVVIGPLMKGYFAILDTKADILTPQMVGMDDLRI